MTCRKCGKKRNPDGHTQYYGNWFCKETSDILYEEWRAQMTKKQNISLFKRFINGTLVWGYSEEGKEGSKDSSSVARTSSEAPSRTVSRERPPSGSAGPSFVSQTRCAGECVASHSEAAPPLPPEKDIIDFVDYGQTVSNDDLFQLWASLGLKGSPSKEALFDLIQFGAAVQQSPVIPEVDPLAIDDVVVIEASDGSGQTPTLTVADVTEGPDFHSEHPLMWKLGPTVFPASVALPRGSALTETPLRRTDDAETLPRDRLRRKARPPLCRRGLPSPYKGVKRRLLFGSSSSSSPVKDSSCREQTVAVTPVDISADRSRSPAPARSSLPAQALVPSGQKGFSHNVGEALPHQVSPARPSIARKRRRSPDRQRPPPRQRSPARQCSPARQHPPTVESPDSPRQRSPDRRRSPARQHPPAIESPDSPR
ncbi:uncharacterized protein [Palaemon carinicauda]|uniref:uncharacterized protein n=1 Tax=Palaemon carinicauda TaxID=392227 RepID=UPI0035B5E706